MENNKRESRPLAVSAGKKLKEAREKKSLAIDQVQKATRIHSTVLIALEEGRASDLLTDTYVRSFLKQYSQFLGLNSVELLKEYFPARQEGSLANLSAQNNSLPKEALEPPKFLYMAIIAVVGVIAAAILIFLVLKVSASVKKMIVSQKKTVVAVKKASPARGTKPVVKKKPAKKAAEPKEIIPKSSPLILSIKVKETALVKLKKDGILIFETVLTKGLNEKIIADKSIEIDTGKLKSLELTLNDRPIELPGDKAMRGIEITRKGIKLK